jgi:hypothetical protein
MAQLLLARVGELLFAGVIFASNLHRSVHPLEFEGHADSGSRRKIKQIEAPTASIEVSRQDVRRADAFSRDLSATPEYPKVELGRMELETAPFDLPLAINKAVPSSPNVRPSTLSRLISALRLGWAWARTRVQADPARRNTASIAAEKVRVAAGNSRRMEARLSHWHNGGYARRSQPPRWGGKARNVPRKIRALLRPVGSTRKCVGINGHEQRPEIEITELGLNSLAGQS